MKKKSPIGFVLSVYLSGVVTFALLRFAAIVWHCTAGVLPNHLGTLLVRAMCVGWLFDTAMCCCLISVPLLMAVVVTLAGIRHRGYYWVGFAWVGVGFPLCLLSAVTDIRFYHHFATKLNAVAINETDSIGTILNMIIGEPAYLFFLILFVLLVASYWVMLNGLFGHFHATLPAQHPSHCPHRRLCDTVLLAATFLIFLCGWGMRGNLTHKTPTRMCESSFCSDGFFNQIGLNPVFTFVKSAEEVRKSDNEPPDLMDAAEAEAVYRTERATPLCDSLMLPGLALPLPQRTNVVLVMMESMTVNKIGLFDPSHSLTPNLNSLMDHSLTFAQHYSTGIHTYNGIYSILYSYPAILARHMLKHTHIPQMHGIPQVLHEGSYQTTYFMPHTDDFDNMRRFLYCNGFDSFFGRQAYPADAPEGTWGVPDHVMFDHAMRHYAFDLTQHSYQKTIINTR